MTHAEAMLTEGGILSHSFTQHSFLKSYRLRHPNLLHNIGSAAICVVLVFGVAICSFLASQPSNQSGPIADGYTELKKSLCERLVSIVEGDVICPGDSNFEEASRQENKRFDDYTPSSVVYCDGTADVVALLKFREIHNATLSVRSGGHSASGFGVCNECIVVDLSHMRSVVVDPVKAQANIEAGATVDDIMYQTSPFNLYLPPASSPTVGFSGYVLSGGMGDGSRVHGLVSDHLISATVALATGEVVVCDKDQNQDLFWAIQGGGGGQFGILTSAIVRLNKMPEVTLFGWISYPMIQIHRVFELWHGASYHANEFAMLALIGNRAGEADEGYVTLVGHVWIGDPISAGHEFVRPFLLLDGVESNLKEMTFKEGFDAMKNMAIHTHGVFDRILEVDKSPSKLGDSFESNHRQHSLVHNIMVPGALTTRSIDAIVKWVGTNDLPPMAQLICRGMGGAISEKGSMDSAFVHRKSVASCDVVATWTHQDEMSVAENWVTGLASEVRSAIFDVTLKEPGSYVGQTLSTLDSWSEKYYGVNVDRLHEIKLSLDSTDVFHSAQSLANPDSRPEHPREKKKKKKSKKHKKQKN